MVANKHDTSNKSLFKRKRGLSKFYANKSQSFSTMDHALLTCLGHSALALEKPRQRSVEPAPKSDVDMEVTSRAMHRLQTLISSEKDLGLEASATSDLCTVLEQSSLSHCESENSTATVESGVNLSERKRCRDSRQESSRRSLETHSCPLPRCDSDISLEVCASLLKHPGH